MLNKYFKIYIPTKDRDGIRINNINNVIDKVNKDLLINYGGSTIYKNVIGSWLDANNNLHKEKISIIEVFYNQKELQEKTTIKDFTEKTLQGLCKRLAKELNQECITYVINGTMFFVTQDKTNY